jgi:hypothetical protein
VVGKLYKKKKKKKKKKKLKSYEHQELQGTKYSKHTHKIKSYTVSDTANSTQRAPLSL